ncbi:DUF2161 family putative PD-(D/E)XK-type phosphodiesterase [Clostridium sp. MD294]|uniref:DUF2161 family putative PD-(D/E)XK-type phosphodiesterase n=1 Tax=Clostridium sp. MD294 TaxID=97138 RepID=UPI0002CC48B8|nr:DUF2161 family putative PD-(D/E)XK-type phosphodiesterase [Clostridium sp. MD294]NDO47782.1 hypothetical protein [Clostridium sp. MD294]USF29900.1 hypothetical protein C820_001320 [Clostridium sp. MD294]
MKSYREMDLYAPVCEFFTKQNYSVKSEVNGCDVVAQKENDIVIVELKKTFQLKLVYQAIDRQTMCENVFVAIPRPIKSQNTKQFQNMLKLLKRLGIGLLTVAVDSPIKTVDVLLQPNDNNISKNNKKSKKLLLEMQQRTGDYNVGGMTRKKIITAYKEKALELCCILQQKEEVSCAFLRKNNIKENHIKMLNTNVYQWYERVSRGVYRLSEKGKEILEQKEYKEVITYYQKKWKSVK